MLTIISLVIALIVVITQFWVGYIGVIYLAIVTLHAYASILYFRSKSKSLTQRKSLGLSEEAYEVLKKYHHHFEMPFATKDYASLCALHQFIAIILFGINVYQGIYWAIGGILIFWYAFANASVQFNPEGWLRASGKIHLYEEIWEMIERKKRELMNERLIMKSID
jgi:hypothetical protein